MGGWRDSRAFAAIDNYLYEVRTGDAPRRHSAQSGASVPREAARDTKTLPTEKPPTEFDIMAQSAALTWENEKIREWRSHGRMTPDGRLRVSTIPLRPYTQKDLMHIMPHLNVFDRLAALIDLDGVVEEGFMDAHENIREVVQTIARDELEKVLETPEAKARIAEIAFEQIGAVFGSLLEKIKGGSSTTKVGGRKLKCSICKEPGHRAPTCPKKETPAAGAAAGASGDDQETGQ